MVRKEGVVMDNFHACVSVAKSITRIIGCLFLFAPNVPAFAMFMICAECLGVAEEWDDL